MSKKMIMMIVPVLLVVLGGVYMFVLKPAPAPVDEKALAKEPAGIYTITEPFVVNLADTTERRFAKVGVALQYSELSAALFGGAGHGSAADAVVIPEEPEVQDIIISTLQERTAHELATKKGRVEVKEMIVKRINKETELKIIEVFYTEFAVQ